MINYHLATQHRHTYTVKTFTSWSQRHCDARPCRQETIN